MSTPYARNVRAVNALHVFGALQEHIDHCFDAVQTFCECGDPTACYQMFEVILKRCGIAVCWDRGLSIQSSNTCSS